jgi:predicted KAP-like P-loop ATPase
MSLASTGYPKTISFELNEISIITDEPLTDAPDLNEYSKTLSNIIINSQPRSTVGIYGGWGTGKTTIMQMIQRHLDEVDNNIITIWFDAWRQTLVEQGAYYY